MDKMTFQTFSWPENPEKLQHTYEREPVYTKDGDGNRVFAEMGAGTLVIQGSGVFWGENACSDFGKLIALFEAGSCGILHDPTWGDCNAYLTELELTQEPRSEYVAYRFTFTRANANGEIP